jgi:hypothetical protein
MTTTRFQPEQAILCFEAHGRRLLYRLEQGGCPKNACENMLQSVIFAARTRQALIKAAMTGGDGA